VQVICGVTSTQQMQLENEFPIHLIEFEAWWPLITDQKLLKIITMCKIHLGYQKMHLVCHIWHSIWQMGLDNNSTTDIAEWLPIGNVQEAYGSIGNVNYIGPMLKHTDWSISPDHVKQTLSYLALQSLYDSDSASVLNLLSTADKWQNTCRGYLLCCKHCQDMPFFYPVS
jgi:hypothetical protein